MCSLQRLAAQPGSPWQYPLLMSVASLCKEGILRGQVAGNAGMLMLRQPYSQVLHGCRVSVVRRLLLCPGCQLLQEQRSHRLAL